MSRLMVIDDNPLEHFILRKMLRAYPLFREAAFFLDGADAIRVLSGQDELPDLILLDLYMPCFSGWEFLERFGQLYPSFKKNIGVYVLSSSVAEPDKTRAFSFPSVKGFYTKPVKKDDLAALYRHQYPVL